MNNIGNEGRTGQTNEMPNANYHTSEIQTNGCGTCIGGRFPVQHIDISELAEKRNVLSDGMGMDQTQTM